MTAFKSNTNLNELPPFLPGDFFRAALLLHPAANPSELKKKHLLPDVSDLFGSVRFSDIRMGWDASGLSVKVDVDLPPIESSVELFFDTRDLKEAGYPTRFCHHFLFTTEESGKEITRLRNEEKRPLCEPESLQMEFSPHKKRFEMEIFIPSYCLYGYDPLSFDRLGMSYRINSPGMDPQVFIGGSNALQMENHPAYWCSCQLLKK